MISVRADAPRNTIEDFLAARRAKPGEPGWGTRPRARSGTPNAALEDRVGVRYNPIPFGGAAAAVLAPMGEHVDAVAVSPAMSVLREALKRLSIGCAYADAQTFRASMKRGGEVFSQLVQKPNTEV